MKLKAALALVTVLAMAGCSPSTAAAHQRCVDYLVQTYKEVTPTATPQDVSVITEASDRGCSKDQAADPDAFNEQWGDE